MLCRQQLADGGEGNGLAEFHRGWLNFGTGARAWRTPARLLLCPAKWLQWATLSSTMGAEVELGLFQASRGSSRGAFLPPTVARVTTHSRATLLSILTLIRALAPVRAGPGPTGGRSLCVLDVFSVVCN
jgi:hypothetical protein